MNLQAKCLLKKRFFIHELFITTAVEGDFSLSNVRCSSDVAAQFLMISTYSNLCIKTKFHWRLGTFVVCRRMVFTHLLKTGIDHVSG